MARPERKTVDYFPHYISDGKKMFYIQQKYGNDGYATWFKILESLASTENHFLNLNSEMDIMFLSAKCMIKKDVLLDIINDLCTLQEIDEFLWMNKIIYSHKFMESIQDAYARRSNKCITYEGLCIQLKGLCTTINRLSYEKKYINTQSKVKDTKVEDTKSNKIKKNEIPNLIEFMEYVYQIPEYQNKFESLKFSIQSKYESWIENDWKDGHDKPIKNWKSKIKNTLPHLKAINVNSNNNGKSKQQLLNDDLQEWVDSYKVQSDKITHDRTNPHESGFEDCKIVG